MLYLFSRVLPTLYISETSVENISHQIIHKRRICIKEINLLATKSSGISYLKISGIFAINIELIKKASRVRTRAPMVNPEIIRRLFLISLLMGTRTPLQDNMLNPA